jgi:2-oxoglutarate ferredoxin oxidoreductase subunit alpha
MMQAKWGSHGDYEIIAVCPNSPQEAFDLTIHAFNLAETYRVPTLVMLDEAVGHMTERVVIPKADQIEIVPRRFTKLPPGEYLPFRAGADLVPEMIKAGDGYRVHVTGLTHDEKGYPAMNWQAQEKLIHRIVNKIRLNADEIVKYEETDVEGAEVVVISYGITSRVALRGIELAQQKGVKAGLHRLQIAWPFPEKRVAELARKAKAIVVVEMNYGQMVREVERVVKGACPVVLLGHGGGNVHDPKDIAEAIVAARAERRPRDGAAGAEVRQ